MDDNSVGPGKPKAGSRHSLVERAAERIAAEARKSRPLESKPVPVPAEQPLPSTPLGGGPDEEVMAGIAEEGTPREQSVEEALRVAALEGAPPAEAVSGTAPVQRRRQSRVVKIDFEALKARNILTPDTKRNRTLEEFRLIKRMVLSRRWDHGDAPGNTIVVTSALPSEGKTTTAINLAMSIAAEEDLRVLLVDADFIKPDALRQLGVSASKGLIDVLQDPRMDISDVMLRTNIDKLTLIPAGQLHERCTELLASARMDELIRELATRYEDRILIFDSPPILVTTESVTLASHMGQIVFVVQAGRTKRESLQNALELIGDRPQLGLVLNRTTARLGNTEFGSYYGSYYYGYGQGAAQPEAQGQAEAQEAQKGA
ncbi:MAG: XrtA-associated tyrosine autokinase [Kiloniellaceae bacterium]